MGKKFSQLDEKSSLGADDLVAITDADTGTSKYVRGSTIGGSAGSGGGSLIAEWNRTNTDQFDLAGGIWLDRHPSNSRIDAMSLTVVPNSEVVGGNVLRMEPSAVSGAGDGAAVILWATAIATTNFVLEVDIVNHAANGFGICALADPGADIQSDLFAYCHCAVGTTPGWMLEDGLGVGGTAPNYRQVDTAVVASSERGLVRFRVEAELTNLPRGRFLIDAVAPGQLNAIVTDIQQFNDLPTALWQTKSPFRWGLCQYAGVGASVGPTDISGIRLYDLR